MNNNGKFIELVSSEKEFLNQIRQATVVIHQQVEALPISRSLLSEHVTISDYQFYLLCMKEVMELYDFFILPVITPLLPDADERRKLPALLSDLYFLEKNHKSSQVIQPLSKPVITNIAEAVGMAYVIEGSTLGGRVIIKHLQQKFNLDPLTGAAFFTGYAEKTGGMWKAFVEVLTRYAVREKRELEVVKGAVQAFNIVYSHLFTNGKRYEN